MADTKAVIALSHKTKKYKGKTYHSFVGDVKVGGQPYLLSINADNIKPVVKKSEYKNKPQHTVWVNMYTIEADEDGNYKKSNEID